MKNILLPTDFSENSWNAITYAIHFFDNLECNFYLLHVSQLNNFVANDTPVALVNNQIEVLYLKPSRERLRALLKRISELEINLKRQKFYTLTDYGFFIESIRNNVEEKGIDYIVMGTKGASGLRKIILGTNTADVITQVKCDTLVVPENARYESPKEMAFPTDFSLSHRLEILQPISDVLERFQASLKIIYINKGKTDLNHSQLKNKELLVDYFNGNQFTFHELTDKNVEAAINNFVKNEGIQLICMVGKNLNYFQQIFFHSKVEAISYHTEIPFLVLHDKN